MDCFASSDDWTPGPPSAATEPAILRDCRWPRPASACSFRAVAGRSGHWMNTLPQPLPGDAARVVGDPHPLLAQLAGGPAVGSLRMDPALITDRESLREFLEAYRSQLLEPVELPGILRAFGEAGAGHVRELIQVDRELTREPRLAGFAAASRAVGRSQLRRLLPMRDQRVVRRYWDAVGAGEAHGWHVVVYGVVLAVYAIPLRQGLAAFAHQTLRGFVRSAAGPLKLTESDREQLIEGFAGAVRVSVEKALRPTGPTRLLTV